MGVCLVLGGCGSTQKSVNVTPRQITVAFKGSPAPLADLHAQANRLLSGGEPAFRTLLASLRGYPVVVNKWASWCGPCRFEFPAFQRAGITFGRTVAFVGVNGKQDSRGDAAAFLKSFPVTYPSYFDPDESIARTIEAVGYDPLTVFLNRSGKVEYVHAGAYSNTAALERDIRRYALG
jgi:thiol-disulfide isomerase/thioredoxin